MPGFTHIAGPASNSLGSTCSKTFAILENIGKSHLQDVTLKANFTWNDHLIPYSKMQLPEDENENLEYADRFIEEQDRILSEFPPPKIIQSLRRQSKQGHPPHIQTGDIEAVYNVVQRGLGEGRYGQVDKVKIRAIGSQEDDRSSDVFAMKRTRKPAPRGSAERLVRSTVSEFEAELRNLRKCAHSHIIHLRASFTDHANFGFIVYPVAERTLQELLSHYISENLISEPEHKSVQKALVCSFGCLLEAVRYLHDEVQIKHRDIKPRNILMRDKRFLICDLGSAYDFEDRKESTDTTRPPGTRKYKAPEVLENVDSSESPKHNSKVDIFSLGCIFLEIYTVLCEQTLDEMAEHITQIKNNYFEGKRIDWTYASSLEHVDGWLAQISEPDGLGEGPCSLIKSMVRFQPYLVSARIFSADLRRQLCRKNSERKPAKELLQDVRTKYFKYIGECCRSLPETSSPPPDRPPSPPPRTTMQFSVRRTIKSCKIGRRTPTSGLSGNPVYGDYDYFVDHSKEGELEIQQVCRDDVWASTRVVELILSESVESQCKSHTLCLQVTDLSLIGDQGYQHITWTWKRTDEKLPSNGRIVIS